MRQKYIVSKNDQTKAVTIQEYAVVDNDSYRKDKYLLTDADFVLLSEQSYPLSELEKKIAGGREGVIGSLRKDEFFPARRCAEKIAESIAALFNSDSDDPIVLVFDDKEGFSQETPEEEETNTAEKEDSKAEPAE